MRSLLLRCAVCVAVLNGHVLAADGLTDAEEAIVDASIVKALQYLAANQQKTGAWRNDSYGDCTAITSLAVMAFMASGHVPDEGDYGEPLTRGIRWVLDH